MKKRRVTSVLAVLVSVLVLGIPALLIPGRAAAQGSTDTPTPTSTPVTTTYTIDFTGSTQGWVACDTHSQTSWTASYGWSSIQYFCIKGQLPTYSPPPQSIMYGIAWYAAAYQRANDLNECTDSTCTAYDWGNANVSTPHTYGVEGPILFSGHYFRLQTNNPAGNRITTITFTLYQNSPWMTLTPTNTPTTTLTPTPTFTPTLTSTPVPTQAPSGSCVSAWQQTFNFTESAGGWTNRPSRDGEGIQDSTGFHTVPGTVDGYTGYSEHLVIQRTIGFNTSETVVGSINLDVTYNAGDAGDPDIRAIRVLHGSTVLIEENQPASGHKTLSWSGSSNGGTFYIEVYASGMLVGAGNNGSATVNSISFSGAGTNPDGSCQSTAPSSDANSWAYPVASRDRAATESLVPMTVIFPPVLPILPFTDIPFSFQRDGIEQPHDQRDAQGAVGFFGHSATGAPINIHSMTSGTVAEVRALWQGSGQCIGLDLLHQWPAYSCQGYVGASTRYYDYGSAYLIKIDTGTAFLYYMVANATVSEGQSVSKGCVLGNGLAFYVLEGSGAIPAGITSAVNKSNDTYSMVWARDENGEPFDLVPYLKEEPQDIRCQVGGGGAGAGGCAYVHDPYFFFNDTDNPWQAMGAGTQHPTGTTSGYWLRDAITQGLNLDTTHQYTISVNAHLLNPSAGPGFRVMADFDAPRPANVANSSTVFDFTVQLGANTATTIVVSSTNSETTTIDADTYLPLDGAYTLTLAPTSHTQDNIVIDFVCVSDTESGPPAPAGGCLFLNPEFETTGNWDLTDGGNGLPIISKAVVYVPHDSSIAQSLTLHPKDGGPQNYTLTINAARQGVPSAGESVSFDWSYSSASGTVGTYPDNTFRDGTDTFSVSNTTTADFTITTNASTSSQVGIIDSVCVTTTDGADPPGYQPPAAPALTPTCKSCVYVPVGDVNYDLPGVIAWLMCGIAQIWNCQMKQILYGIWQVATNILMFLALARAWMGLTMVQLVEWANADVRIFTAWLNGALANLQTTITGIIASWGPHDNGSGTNLWDALVALFNGLRDVLGRLINAILALATVFLQLLGSVIGLIINAIVYLITQFVNILKSFIDLIMSALNAPPVAPAGVPVCDDNAETIYENCVAIFMIDNTLLADNSPISVMLPLVEGAAGFGLLWWGINKIRTAIMGRNDT